LSSNLGCGIDINEWMKELGIDRSNAYCVPCYWTYVVPMPGNPEFNYNMSIGVLLSNWLVMPNVFANVPLNTEPPSIIEFYMNSLCTGQTVYLGAVTSNTPLSGGSSGFVMYYGREISPPYGEIISNPNTSYFVGYITANIGYVYGPVEFYAVGNGIKFAPFRAVVYIPTRITLSVSPSTVYPNWSSLQPGEKVTVYGKLEKMVGNCEWMYGNWNPNCKWAGVPDQPVSISLQYISDYGPVKTDSNGNFSITITVPPYTGKYTVKAKYEGGTDWLWGSEASASIEVVNPATPSTTTTTQQTKPTTSTTTTTQPSTTTTTIAPPSTTTKPKLSAGDLAILLGGAGLLTGITAYGLSKKGKT